MNISTATIVASIATLASASQARLIIEDFDGADFNSELTFDFSSDFTGGGDTSDHMDGVLWLYADLANVSVNSLAAGEYIESVEVTWTDFCGPGCTELTVYGLNNFASVGNVDAQGSETVFLSTADLGGEQILSFDLSSFEGRIDRLEINVVPTPSSLALLGMGGLMMARRRR